MLNLERFQVYFGNQHQESMSVSASISDGFDRFISNIKCSTGSPTTAVATSVYLRRYGFFIAALLYLKAYNKMWDGSLDNIHLVETTHGLVFEIDDHYIRDEQPGDLELIVKKYGFPVVNELASRANISKFILWENIWGYVLWMYGSTETKQARLDLEMLLEDDIWQPDIRRSMFKKFLNGRTFEDAATNYERVTCCLYKELPGSESCPYCPHVSN
ncbi:hypothetical protein [Halalkalibacter okhensis]|uniref:hypothetical protein n=1 Tax=Halalkalibacter okhensis TaxID=333138 RepID=UPI000691E057|nr:hypothetical protein [Halalkalibacter okhensis]